MRQITLNIPEDALFAMKVPEQEAGEEICMAAAVKMFEMGRLSSGAAAKLAGIPRSVFLTRLADYGVEAFSFTEEEFQEETRLG